MNLPVFAFLAMAAHTINRLAQDRGLAACFTSAGVKTEQLDLLKAKYGWEILEDFVQWFPKESTTEPEKVREAIDTAVGAVSSLKDNKIVYGRVMSALEVGRATISLSLSSNPGSMSLKEEEESLLDEATTKSVNSDWENRYHFEFDPFVDPSDGLKAKIYREFRKKSANSPPAKKCKSVMASKLPDSSEVVNLPGNVRLSLDAQRDLKLECVVSYFFALRTLANAWAWAGNYQTESKIHQDASGRAVRVPMMPFDTATNYPDFCLRMTLTYGNSSVQWLLQRDEATRARMASGIRRGFPAQEALTRALEETHQDWRSRSMQALPEDVQLEPTKDQGGGGAGGGAGRQKRPDAAKAESPKKKARSASNNNASEKTKKDAVKTISMVKGGLRLCKAWNDNRGCSARGCKDLHECDVRLPSGGHCGAKDHNRINHP